MAVCERCGFELQGYEWGDRGHNPRKWCSQVCRQLAYIDRKKDAAMTDPEQSPLIVEAYGVVTPPPESVEKDDS